MYRKKVNGWLKHGDFMLIDIVCIQIAFALAYYFRCRNERGYLIPYLDAQYINLAIYLAVADILVMFLYRTMSGILRRDWVRELQKSINHSAIMLLFVSLYLFSIKESELYSRIVIYTTLGIYTLMAVFLRSLWKRFLRNVRWSEKTHKAVLVICNKENAERVVRRVKMQVYENFKVSGVILADVENCRGLQVGGVPVVSSLKNGIEFLRTNWIDEVFVHCSSDLPDIGKMIVQMETMGITVHLNLSFEKYGITGSKTVEEFCGYTVLTSSISMASAEATVLKRTMDILGGLVGCAITLVLMVILSPIIYFNSPGPILFTQERVGRNGKKFRMFKFRSMYLDAEERKKEYMEKNRIGDGLMFKMDFDTRVIGNYYDKDGNKKRGIGDFIRKTSLDEFPQFFNVLIGDMSLVGTRPPTVDEWERYALHHRARLSIKPGITGLWQVSGRSNITEFEEVVRLDTKYIQEWSLFLDVKILLKTVRIVLFREGAM